jgi:hypothetical protein
MDGQSIQPEKLAILGLEVTRPMATSLQVSVVPFHLILDLNLASGQLSIAAPQSLFSGKFSGLCGEFFSACFTRKPFVENLVTLLV